MEGGTKFESLRDWSANAQVEKITGYRSVERTLWFVSLCLWFF